MYKSLKLIVLLLISLDSFSQLYVNSKDDPRLKSYNDSLYLYNYTLRQRRFVDKYANDLNYLKYKNFEGNQSLQDTAFYWLKLDKSIIKNYKSIDPLYTEDPVLLMSFISDICGSVWNTVYWSVSVYKKPIIKVIYKPREYYIYINGPNGVMRDKDFIARYGYENYIKYFKIN